MRINFDEIGLTLSAKRASTIHSPIKIQIQSPIYNQVIRQLSPHNYKAEITSMNSVISLPQQISQFIAHEVEKQLEESMEFDVESPSYFYGKTKSLANINKDMMMTKSTTMSKQTLNTTKHSNKPNNTTKRKKVNINYKKHACSDHVPTSARQALKQCEQLTYAPRLYHNELNQKVDFNRKVHAYVTNSNKNCNVYESLYQEASIRRIRTQMNKQLQEESRPERKPKINNHFFARNNKVYTPLHNRLNQILYRRVDRIKDQQRLDMTSGRQLFKPDLNNSKDSYKIYLRSLSKDKIETAKATKKKSMRFIEIKQEKVKSSTSNLLKQELRQSRAKQSPIDIKTVEYFTEIFYPNNSTEAPLMATAPENAINKQQFMVLHAFLHEIEELESKRYEQETTVSSSRLGMSAAASKIERVLSKQDFQQKLKKYYQGLNLHDRQILRQQIRRQNKMKHKQKDEQTSHHHAATFRPSINIRSSSLDDLARGHIHQIYYV